MPSAHLVVCLHVVNRGGAGKPFHIRLRRLAEKVDERLGVERALDQPCLFFNLEETADCLAQLLTSPLHLNLGDVIGQVMVVGGGMTRVVRGQQLVDFGPKLAL